MTVTHDLFLIAPRGTQISVPEVDVARNMAILKNSATQQNAGLSCRFCISGIPDTTRNIMLYHDSKLE
jgi:hypothetical protein